jgi:hypothetical protein
VTAIATSCASGTAYRWRLRWRLIGLVTINLAVWTAIILLVKACS